MRLILTLLVLTLTNCNNNEQSLPIQTEKLNTSTNSLTIKENANSKKIEINCGSIYQNKGYKITLSLFDSNFINENGSNSLFVLSKLSNGKYLPIFSDSILNEDQEIHFRDFNNDKVKDILIQNISDVRSNWTYYLYIVDTLNDQLKKIKGFEKIKNPEYIAAQNLVDNYVLSGRNWTNFYRIINDTIKDYDIIVYDDQNDLTGKEYKFGFEEAI